MEYKYQAIIVGKTDVSETDRIYTIYSREAGKSRVLACGVRKPNAKLAGSLEPVTCSEVFIAKGKGKGRITGAIVLEIFLTIKGNFFALQKIFYIFKIFNRLVQEEEKDEQVFLLILEYLLIMEKCAKKNNEMEMEILTYGFIFKLLDFLGYGLEMKKCVKCLRKLKKSQNFFSTKFGGTLCADCSKKESKKIKIDDDSVKFIRIFLDNKISSLIKIKASDQNLKNLKIITSDVLNWLID